MRELERTGLWVDRPKLRGLEKAKKLSRTQAMVRCWQLGPQAEAPSMPGKKSISISIRRGIRHMHQPHFEGGAATPRPRQYKRKQKQKLQERSNKFRSSLLFNYRVAALSQIVVASQIYITFQFRKKSSPAPRRTHSVPRDQPGQTKRTRPDIGPCPAPYRSRRIRRGRAHAARAIPIPEPSPAGGTSDRRQG